MSLMVTKIGIPQVRLAFNHSKYLNTHADKLKVDSLPPEGGSSNFRLEAD